MVKKKEDKIVALELRVEKLEQMVTSLTKLVKEMNVISSPKPRGLI